MVIIKVVMVIIMYLQAEAAQQKASEKFEAISEEAKKGVLFININIRNFPC